MRRCTKYLPREFAFREANHSVFSISLQYYNCSPGRVSRQVVRTGVGGQFAVAREEAIGSTTQAPGPEDPTGHDQEGGEC